MTITHANAQQWATDYEEKPSRNFSTCFERTFP